MWMRESSNAPLLAGMRIARAQAGEQRVEFVESLIQRLGRTVAVYGMITLRTDGKDILFAQNLERPVGESRKGDLHLLEFKDGAWVYTSA